jgi:hypothetical protein
VCRSVIFLVLLPIVATCTACEPLGGKPPATQLNPTPVQAYPFTLKIEEAPGDFKHISVGAQYDVANIEECGRIHPMTGTKLGITRIAPVLLEPISEVEFRGTVYADRMRDQDYHGNGICRWRLSGTSAVLKATGADEETRFIYHMDLQDVLEGGTHSRLYVGKDFPIAIGPNGRPLHGFSATGQEMASGYIAELRNALFRITMTSEGRAP